MSFLLIGGGISRMFKVIHNVYGGIRMDKKQKITLNDELVKKTL